ncbi:hypothetical protein [Methyloferula stellata]|uniref:hypothetical protein n=1 Tax=Methyloferula stellata TaxID=876270 RepID=UPI000365AB28|nr:hypothetical protein [Methyloferula stellata]
MREQIFGSAALIFLSSASCAIAEDSFCKCMELKDPNQKAECIKQCVIVKHPYEPRPGGTAFVPNSKDNWATGPWQPSIGGFWTIPGESSTNRLVIERKPNPEWDWTHGQTPLITGPNT